MGKRKGFTLIEVALFLAVTAALFIGIALGMNNSIYQQRRNDSVQNFLEFMRSIYSKVSNPQNTSLDVTEGGRSGQAIYGKLVVFGEGVDLSGDTIPADQSPVFTYDILGDAATNIVNGDVFELLKNLNATVLRIGSNNKVEAITPEKYEPRWGAGIENETGGKFEGSIMVVRHPKTGTINTLRADLSIPVNEQIGSSMPQNDVNNFLKSYSFVPREVDFCVNPNGVGVSAGMAPRQDIRIAENARNASSVKLIDLDDKWSEANKNGNKCYR